MTLEPQVTLGQFASARSGDKGNHANIGIVARDAHGFAFLREQLTASRVADFFRGLGITRVERFELPEVWAFNFLLYNALRGGASQSLHIDSQGKLLGTAILSLKLPLDVASASGANSGADNKFDSAGGQQLETNPSLWIREIEDGTVD